MGSGRRCAQCEGAIKISNIENMFLFFSISPGLPFAKLGGGEEIGLVEVTSLLILKEVRVGGAYSEKC